MPPSQKDPFTSSRLTYRAIQTPEDNNLFQAINDDRQGYMNSNATNNMLPGISQSQKFQKEVADDCLLGAVICITPSPTPAPDPLALLTAPQHGGRTAHSNGEPDREREREEAEAEGNHYPEEVNASRIFREPQPKARKEYGTPIGEIHLKSLPASLSHHRTSEIGLDILPEYQGRGYGSEAINWALDYAFRRAALHRVSIRAFGWNEGALRLYGRLGFREEGRLRESLWHEGRWWDGVIFGMLEGEWAELRRREG
ncbi:acyl-CoA N-acyltransferase [Lophiostoma macrostomum CBS 122681]|uniref:Acyl-CoA N-acyltransferase n=1 Tax=Lophiostoma macrostomum CBS 122681 TaxID=1314788 RepID=A0A6A6T0I2_9PLEO|nr:acyl-CoA N-acyltransferase [Lophiostoma macrostomum CBS 122681]